MNNDLRQDDLPQTVTAQLIFTTVDIPIKEFRSFEVDGELVHQQLYITRNGRDWRECSASDVNQD